MYINLSQLFSFFRFSPPFRLPGRSRAILKRGVIGCLGRDLQGAAFDVLADRTGAGARPLPPPGRGGVRGIARTSTYHTVLIRGMPCTVGAPVVLVYVRRIRYGHFEDYLLSCNNYLQYNSTSYLVLLRVIYYK